MQTPLLVLSLLMVSHLAAAAAVQQLWTSCDQASNVEPNATLYESINCSYPDRFITITLKKPATVTLRDGSVKSGRGFTFTTTLPSIPAGPIAITVSNLLFGPNAVLTFDGPLPNSSTINFSGNRFVLTDAYSFNAESIYSGVQTSYYWAGMDVHTATVAIIVNVRAQTLEFANLAVANNTVEAVTTGTRFVAAVVLRVFLPIDNSFVSLYNNTLRDSKAQDAATVVWQFGDPTLSAFVTHIKNSNVSLRSNIFINSTVSGVGTAAYWYSSSSLYAFRSSCSISLTVENSTVALMENKIMNSKVDGDGTVAYWFFLCDCVNLRGSATSHTLLITNSTIYFGGNLLSNSTVGGSAYVVFIHSLSSSDSSSYRDSMGGENTYTQLSHRISLINNSSLLLNNNFMANARVKRAVVARWYIYTFARSYGDLGGSCVSNVDIDIRYASIVSFDGNSIADTIVGDYLTVTHWYIYSNTYTSMPVATTNAQDLVASRSTISFNGNRIMNTTVASNLIVISWYGRSDGKFVDGAGVLTGSIKYSLLDNSTLSISGNTAMHTNSSSGIILASIDVPQRGWDRIAMLIDGNHISTVRAASVTVLAFLPSSVGTLRLLSFSFNVFTAIEAPFEPIVLTNLPVIGSLFINTNQFRISSVVSSISPLVSFGNVSLASSVEVVRNFIQANVTNQLLHFQSINVSDGGQVLISRNVVNAYKVSNTLVAVSQLRLAGSVSVHLSRIGFAMGDFNTSGYRLLRDNFVNMSGEAMALICNNIVFGKILQPEDLFSLPELATKVVKACTESPSATITPSDSLTVEAIATASTRTMSALSTATVSSSETLSNSANVTKTFSLASTASTTRTTSESRSDTQSKSESPTASSSLTKSISVSITQTLTGLVSQPSPSLSGTLTCKDLGGLNENETCSVLRPLPSDWKQELYTQWAADTRPADAAAPTLAAFRLYGNNSDCTIIQVPFTVWRGRQGSVHSIGIVAIDPRVPFHAKVELTPVGGESNNKIFLDAVGLVDLPISLMDNNSTITPDNKTFQTVVATFRYGSNPTMNRIRYQFNCRDFLKCPISMPGDMFVTLVEAERLLPLAVAEAVAVGTAIAVAIGGITVSPTSIVQLGVITSLRSMSRCVSYAVEGEDALDDYSDYTEGVMNPFGLALGSIDVRGYLRGTIVTSIACTAMGCLLMTLLHVLTVQLVGRKKADRTLAGYPSAFIAVISFAMDGATSAGAILGTTAEEWGDCVLGWVSLATCLAYVSHVLYVSKVAFPPTLRSSPTIVENKSDDLIGRERWKEWLNKVTTRSHKWEDGGPTDLSTASWRLRYESYIDDTSVSWYCGLEQAIAVLVCTLAALPLDGVPFCITRSALCTLLLGGQAAVLIVKKAKVEPWRLLLLSVVLSFQTASALLSVVNVPLQDPKVELGMDVLGVATFLLIACSTVVDFLSAATDAIAFAKKVKWRYDRRKRRKSTNHCKIVDDLDLQLIIPPQGQLTPPAELLDSEDDEAAIVRQILLNFAEYEQLQEYDLR